MKTRYINDSIAIAVTVKIGGTNIATSYTSGQIMNNPAIGYGVCRFTAYTSTGGAHGVGNGTTTFSDTPFGAFTSAMTGRSIAVSLKGVFQGYFTITYVDKNTVTLNATLPAGTGYQWAMVAQSNGVNMQDINCYCDSSNTGQGDAIIAYGFQVPDTVAIVPVYGVRNSDGSLNWHMQNEEQIKVVNMVTSGGLTIVSDLPA